MATGTLTSTTIAATYKSLLKVKGGANQTLDGTPRLLEDGDGNDSVLGISNDSVLISGSGTRLDFNTDGSGEYISGDGTDLTIASGADILLSPTTNVGIGNTVPGSLLEISKVSGRASLELSSWSATATAAHAGVLIFQKSGTATLNTFTGGDHTTAGEVLGRIEAYGVDDGDDATLSSYIEFANDAISDADSSPGKIVFATSDAGDAGTPTVALTIDDGQNATFAGQVVSTLGTDFQIGIQKADEVNEQIGYRLLRTGTDPDVDVATFLYIPASSTDFRIHHGGEDSLSVDSDSNLKLFTGNLVIGTPGKGIDFGAQTVSSLSGVTPSTGANEILDHYEQGTWTPTIVAEAGGTDPTGGYATQSGRYIRIGNAVTVWCIVYMASSGVTSGSGTAVVGGLPFTVKNAGAIRGVGAATCGSFGTVKGAPLAATPEYNQTNATLKVYDNDAGNVAAWTNASAADVTDSSNVFFESTYEVD